MRILLVEDDRILRITTSKLLTRWADDKIVDVAEDGESAIRMMQETEYDLVFLDNELPDIRGHDVALRIRQELLHIVDPIVKTASP